MVSQRVVTVGRDGLGETSLSEALLRKLHAGMEGKLLRARDPGYEDACRIFNAGIERRPALIARCRSTADVVRVVRFAREHALLVSVRGGGHSVTGNALCDGGVTIDLSEMRRVRVDPDRRTARAEGGATWGDFDRATQAFGLATTGGIFPSTGIAGLTLGGGLGYLNRKYGLACDNLLSAEVVTADGEVLRTSADEHEALFWGLRGGGGNFGVVTSFEYRVHPVGPVLGGMILYPLEQAKSMLRFYREWAAEAPDEVRVDPTLLSGPEGAALGLPVCYCGSIEEGEKVLRPLRCFGSPMRDTVASVPYETVQNLLAEIVPPEGMHHYWKSGFCGALADDAIEALVDFFTADIPASIAIITLEHLGGAVSRVGQAETAFSHRSSPHSLLVARGWRDPAESEANIAWGRRAYAVAEPFLESGVYVNYLGDEGEARRRAAYGPSYERLVAVKTEYDPTNFFRMNQNIEPPV